MKRDKGPPVQLILDMRVWWSSTYLMLDHTKKKKDVHSKFYFYLITYVHHLFFCSALMLLLMCFDGKKPTPQNVTS